MCYYSIFIGIFFFFLSSPKGFFFHIGMEFIKIFFFQMKIETFNGFERVCKISFGSFIEKGENNK